MVGLGRLERPTSPLSGVRSNHLSYRPGGRARAAAHPSRERIPSRARPPKMSGRRKRNEDGGHPASRGLTGPFVF
jgi:hypothetical protein